jgi:hypothetical protein
MFSFVNAISRLERSSTVVVFEGFERLAGLRLTPVAFRDVGGRGAGVELRGPRQPQ